MRRATAAGAPSATPRTRRRTTLRFDLRDRVAVGNQLLLCGIVVVLFVGGILAGVLSSPGVFAIGTLLIAVATIASLLKTRKDARGDALPVARHDAR